MRDLEEELATSIQRRQDQHGNPLAGLFTLTRRMETEIDDQFDVDMTILDFLAFKATESVFEWHSRSDPFHSDLPSALVTTTAEWRNVLKHRYDGRRLNNQTALRSRLLQFALLFTHRLNHDKTWTNEFSLSEIRARNRSRGLYWSQKCTHSPALREPFDVRSEFPLSDGALAQRRHELASRLSIPVDKRRCVTDVDGTPSLHCLLPLFVELTAARASLEDEWFPTREWMHLAGQFMLQAVLEEYLRNGAYGEETFNTIFAFGCPGTAEEAGEGDDIRAMRRIFCNKANQHEQVHGWAKIRRHYINELLPNSPSVSQLQAMEAAQDRFPYPAFEAEVMAFLISLHEGFDKPDLVQVEEGRITIHGNELGEKESREMIRRMHLDA
ncbi:uncharacterized protein EI97DRAFT_373019 [Westerdykella ornata]|uniref:Uncharacterized protein n=1 Tax=Westerdykella ornata TaxID=318751 RepID=A0A6A6JPF8_WESOR|nr:uncharacterized protein EI97DRAFT_373019 [Westerdykella ornata]KAF2278501.1 hypothetical protein EI97DRAFT_373019 [Westerdykella ornata]